jgi:hypothetical protein
LAIFPFGLVIVAKMNEWYRYEIIWDCVVNVDIFWCDWWDIVDNLCGIWYASAIMLAVSFKMCVYYVIMCVYLRTCINKSIIWDSGEIGSRWH